MQLVPTQRDSRKGRAGIYKRLDKVLMTKNLIEEFERFQSQVGYGISSNHQPILLQIDKENLKHPAPFKFNYLWLEDK